MHFSGATFLGVADFSFAQFSGEKTNFYKVKFRGPVKNISRAKFSGEETNFSEAQFGSAETYFQRPPHFDESQEATFTGNVVLAEQPLGKK